MSPSDSDAAFTRRLGSRLNRCRQMRGMTLKDLAGAVACSESVLSKFERGRNHPSLPMLIRVARALDVDPGFLLTEGPDTEPVIHRRGAPRPSDLPGPAGSERVVAGADGLASCCAVLRIGPGEARVIDPGRDGEETGIVLEGRPSLVIRGRAHPLDAGDAFAFAFRSGRPHEYRNAGPTWARVFRVCTPSAAAT